MSITTSSLEVFKHVKKVNRHSEMSLHKVSLHRTPVTPVFADASNLLPLGRNR